MPLFKSELQRSVEKFLSRVSPSKPFLRANWGVWPLPLALSLRFKPHTRKSFSKPVP